MEGVKKYILVLVFAALVAEEAVSATQHVVGGSQGWDESTDFGSWASAQKFKVGDTLVFKYSSMHSVVELANENAYKSCDIGSSVDSKSGGNTVVKLNKAGTRYFVCGTMGHCDQGMKVKVTTVSADASSSTTATPSSSSSSSSSTPASTSAASHFHPSVISMALFVVFTLFLITMASQVCEG